MIELPLPDLLEDPAVFGEAFGDLESRRNWIVVLKGLFALPMSKSELRTFKELTGRSRAPKTAAREFHGICGRRSGKSRIVALVATFLACFVPYRKYLAPGERAGVLVLAADRRQAKTIFQYCRALIRGCPMLERLVERETTEEIELSSGVTIAIMTASFRAVRSYTCAAVIADEVAFWQSDDYGANPAAEILGALRPSLATIPTSMLLCISSPYRRMGPSFEAFRDYYGVDDDRVLVVKAVSLTMNPTLDRAFIEQEFRCDPQRAASEWDAEFRSDLAAFLSDELIDAAVDHGRPFDLPPAGHDYQAFTDPSGGRGDSFTLSICLREDDAIICDVIRGRKPPFSPGNVVSEFATLLKQYGLSSVTGDRYSAEWCASAFRENDVDYETCPKGKSEIYLECLPLFTTGVVRLPDAKTTIAELRGLERRSGRSGRDTVDHGQGSHDDHANSLCGALWLLAEAPVEITSDMAGVAIGFLGVAVMIGPEAIGSLGIAAVAQLAVLAAAVSYAFAGIYGRRFRATPPLITATGQVTASTVMLCPLALLVDQPWTLALPGPAILGSLLGLGLLSTAAAYVIYFRILASSGATNLLLVTFLVPVSAILLGVLVLSEQLTVAQLAGMGLIALGLAAIDGRMLRWFGSRRTETADVCE